MMRHKITYLLVTMLVFGGIAGTGSVFAEKEPKVNSKENGKQGRSLSDFDVVSVIDDVEVPIAILINVQTANIGYAVVSAEELSRDTNPHYRLIASRYSDAIDDKALVLYYDSDWEKVDEARRSLVPSEEDRARSNDEETSEQQESDEAEENSDEEESSSGQSENTPPAPQDEQPADRRSSRDGENESENGNNQHDDEEQDASNDDETESEENGETENDEED